MSALMGMSNAFSTETLASGLNLVNAASNGMLQDPELEEMQRELKASSFSVSAERC